MIHGVNAEIADREFIVIVGPSGCGKSTLLRMVAGLEEITDGEISIGDRVVNNLEPAERDIAMVFQNYALYPHMSVFDNMAYGLKIKKVPIAEIKTRVDKAAGILELGQLLDRKPRQLSGGQRQRVAMGRAIVRQPQVFLFDEPLSNLDAKLRAQTRIEIQKLHRELGITSLFVTHDQVEAMTLAQRMIVMNAGSDGAVRHARRGVPPARLDLRRQLHRLAADEPADGRAGRPRRAPSWACGPSTWTSAADGWALRVETTELLGAERLIYGRLGGRAGHRAQRGEPRPVAGRPTRPSTSRRARTGCTGSTAASRQAHSVTASSPGLTRAGSPTAAPASWRPRTRWRRSAWARATATACSNATPSCRPTACRS